MQDFIIQTKRIWKTYLLDLVIYTTQSCNNRGTINFKNTLFKAFKSIPSKEVYEKLDYIKNRFNKTK